MYRIAICIILGIAPLAAGVERTSSKSSPSDLLTSPKPEEAIARILQAFGDEAGREKTRRSIEPIWAGVDENSPAEIILEKVVQSFALLDPEIDKLVRQCNAPSSTSANADASALSLVNRVPFVRANVGLYYGRFLVEQRLYDEAWDLLKSLDELQTVDPATLFFFRAVAAQGMLEIKPALASVDRLLANTERVPARYAALATLMQTELKDFEEKSLDEIARLMADSERRLDLGRAGEKVQEVQERIVSILDELIKKSEQQQNGGGGGGDGSGSDQQGGQNNQSANPANDSSIKGAEAPGETDKKKFENKGNWGNLPDKDLTKAKSDLNKHFPSHYEQAIDKYTKKLSGRAAKKK